MTAPCGVPNEPLHYRMMPSDDLRRAPAFSPSRRDVLGVGVSGLLGLSLPRLLAADSRASRADSLIVIFLNGGPSHLDMWDMKPDAPAEIRGPFQPIRTSLPGVQFCEHLPKLARLVHRTTLVRSMHHSVNNSHAAAVYAALTGHDRGEQGGGAKPEDHPPPGSVLTKLRPSGKTAVPYVTLPYKTKEGASGPLQPGFLAGILGRGYDPFWVLQNPDAADFRVPNLMPAEGVTPGRLAGRGELLAKLNAPFGRRGTGQMDHFQQRALDLLTSTDAQRAFQVDREPRRTREAYGRNIYGQSVLLARRLIEAGTRTVVVSWAPHANATWDTHSKNFPALKERLLPPFDAAVSSLLADLADRGLLERTLVAVLGDFGRTPKINKNAGRDHWPPCGTVLMAGGGIQGGRAYGASDASGAYPHDALATPGDVTATVFHALGFDPETTIRDQLNRPLPISNGRPILELFG